METLENMDRRAMLGAWTKLCTSGTPTRVAAHQLRVGLGPFLDAFAEYFLGPEGVGQGFKLVLGMNGEGKTHLLLCLREIALQKGHAVALLEPRSSAAGESEFEFAKEVLKHLEGPKALDADDDELKLVQLLRTAVEKKRATAIEKGLDPDRILATWANGVRMKDLHPHGFANAVADGLERAIDDDSNGLREAVARVTFEGERRSKAQQKVDGAALLMSIPMLVKHLGFEPAVILLDEAETAVEKKGSAKRREFLKFLRFLNDHVARGPGDRAAIVVIGCTDEFWPDQFNEYQALKQRLSDPGKDELNYRNGLSPKALVRLNKLWVRETFRGEVDDYAELGTALVQLAKSVRSNTDEAVQLANAKKLGSVASSDLVRKQVKRNFVKALAQTIETQVADNSQRVLQADEAARALEAAAKQIQEEDAE